MIRTPASFVAIVGASLSLILGGCVATLEAGGDPFAAGDAGADPTGDPAVAPDAGADAPDLQSPDTLSADAPSPDDSAPPPPPPPPPDGGDAVSPPPDATDSTGSPPPTCPWPVEVIIYNEGDWSALTSAFAADASPCADYYISLPSLAADHTEPRGPVAVADIHALGPRFHALAEFHWGAWAAVIAATPGMTWYDAGVQFRDRMVTKGYDLAAGDHWEVNELPSTVRYDAATRTHVENLVRGLYDGSAGSPSMRGAAFTIGMGQGTTYFGVYKPRLEDWLIDTTFWDAMDAHVRWWAPEVYPDPDFSCVGTATVAGRSSHTNAFVEHMARLAVAGPAGANVAQAYFDRAYLPLMNAAWQAPAGYGNMALSADQMKHFVSTQVYAARAWAGAHAYPDGRIGFSWSPHDATGAASYSTNLAGIAARLASAIHYAYDDGGGSAARACSPSGAYTWCQCDVAGAAFNDGWDTFATW